jgi:hypothetical protein
MTQKRGHVEKTDLTPREKVKAIYFHEIRGVAQQVLADMFEVNIGRVNEAIMDIKKAIKWDIVPVRLENE